MNGTRLAGAGAVIGLGLLTVVMLIPATAHAAFIVPAPTPLRVPTSSPPPPPSTTPSSVQPAAAACATPGAAVGAPALPAGGTCPYFGLPSIPGVPSIGAIVGTVSAPVVSAVLGTMVQWVADGAASLLSTLGGFLNQVTAPDIGSSWFQAHYLVMIEIGVLLVLPLLLGAVFTAIVRQDGGLLIRSVLFHLPLAAMGTFLATQLVGLALGATDELCSIVLHNDAGGAAHFLSGMGGQVSGLSSQSGVSGFAVVVAAIVLIVGALAVLLELLMRTAAVYVAVLFLPIVLAGLVWPATLRWARRLVELLAVLILSKFVIVAVLSLAASALASGASGGGLAAMLAGASLLLLAALAPYSLLRLVPFVEAGAAGHLEGVASSLPGRAAHTAGAPVNLVQDLLGGGSDFPAPAGGESPGGTDARTADGARQLAGASSTGLHIADPATFGTGATAEAGAAAGVGAPVAVAVAAQRAVVAAKQRTVDAAAQVTAGTGDTDGR